MKSFRSITALPRAIFAILFLSGIVYSQDQIFSDVPSSAGYFSAANQLYLRGVTSGVSASPLSFGPSQPLTRDQMAVLIIRSIYSAETGNGDTFSYTLTPWFSDVPSSSPYFKYIQKMKDLGITSSCGENPPIYCPSATTTNGQLAVFTVRAWQIVNNQYPNPPNNPPVGPPICAGGSCSGYNDFYNEPNYNNGNPNNASDFAIFHDYIEAAYVLIGRDITSNCMGGLGSQEGYFCTDDVATRSQQAYNAVEGIWKSFALPANTSLNFDMVNPATTGSTLSYGGNNSALFQFAASVYPVTIQAGYSGVGSADAFAPQAAPGTVGFNSTIIMSNLSLSSTHSVLYVRLSASGIVKDYTYLTPAVISKASLKDPTWLDGTVGYVPFLSYDYSTPPSRLANFAQTCPPTSVSIRSCFQQVLHNMRAQGVSGVRLYLTYCDDNGGPLTNCGQPWQQVTWSASASTWIANAGSFFQDVHDAGISKVTISSDLANASTLQQTVATSSTGSPIDPTHICSDYLLDNVVFRPGIPFGLVSDPEMGDNEFPIGDTNQAYNCAPINPYFIGWNNYFNVIDAALGAAQSKVTVEELEGQQELHLVGFTAELRYLYDNSSPTSAGMSPGDHVDVLYRLRSVMLNRNFDTSRVTWSAPWTDSETGSSVVLDSTHCTLGDTTWATGTCNCLNWWGDYSRQSNLDAIYSAIGGGGIGFPVDAFTSGTGGLACGGSANLLFASPGYNGTQPQIVDSHMYPSTLQTPGTSDTKVMQAAELDYSDLAHFFTLPGIQSALVMIGETHDFRVCGADYPPTAPNDNATGFESEGSLNGFSVVIRPFGGVGNPCFPYGPSGAQNENYNWNGPYNPSRYN